MKEQRIEFETAKLAKEKGFTESGDYPLWYNSDGTPANIWSDFWNIKKEDYPSSQVILRTTQSLLQKWLREVHNIAVYVSIHDYYQEYHGKFYFKIYNFSTVSPYYDNYEEALEIGLQEALKLIK